MRVALLAAVLALTACGHHESARSACRLARGPEIAERTGEHSLSLRTSCGLDATPHVDLSGLPFAFVPEGGPRGSHVLVLDKYRCDVRAQRLASTVHVNGARLDAGRTLMDWCPAEAVSSVVHVYLGGVHPRATWRDVLRDVYGDGRLDRVYPCGVLREAIGHLPSSPPMFSPLPARLGRAASAACSAALDGIPRGAPRFAVYAALGQPASGGPRCPVWRWSPFERSRDGARVCFAHGRAELVQAAVHG
jgi:hypothetical protein